MRLGRSTGAVSRIFVLLQQGESLLWMVFQNLGGGLSMCGKQLHGVLKVSSHILYSVRGVRHQQVGQGRSWIAVQHSQRGTGILN